MIFITKGQSNKVVLTLSENVTLTPTPFYIFIFTNSSTLAEVIFIAADTSLAPDRYNLFTIVEQSTGLDPTAGIVELNPAGQWIGEIYESITASLIPANWGGLLQTEMVIVAGVDGAINPVYN